MESQNKNGSFEISKTTNCKSWNIDDFKVNVNTRVLWKMRQPVIALHFVDVRQGKEGKSFIFLAYSYTFLSPSNMPGTLSRFIMLNCLRV